MQYMAVHGSKKGLFFQFKEESLLIKALFTRKVREGQLAYHNFYRTEFQAITTANVGSIIRAINRWSSSEYFTYI